MEELLESVLGWVCIAFTLMGPIAILGESIPEWFYQEKKNREYIKKMGRRLRRRCVDCSYCRTKLYRPFHTAKYRNAFTSYIPSYCRKFHTSLKPDENLRCIAIDAAAAMYEESEVSEPVSQEPASGLTASDLNKMTNAAFKAEYLNFKNKADQILEAYERGSASRDEAIKGIRSARVEYAENSYFAVGRDILAKDSDIHARARELMAFPSAAHKNVVTFEADTEELFIVWVYCAFYYAITGTPCSLEKAENQLKCFVRYRDAALRKVSAKHPGI